MSQPSPQVSPVTAPALPARPAESSQAAPAEAHRGPSTAVPQQPATAPANHLSTQSTASTLAPAPAPQTYVEKLDAGDRDWKWKIGLRALLIIISFIGLGCAGWVVANFTSKTMYTGWAYDMDDGWSIPWVLITFVMSIVWSAICILVFFKSHSPLHPGAQVGVDLILWLGYIVTGMFAILAVASVRDYGSSGLIGNYSSDGPWTYSQGNNTWVYNSNASYSSYSSSRSRSCDSTSSSRTYDSSGFSSCAELDSFINHLWATKNARFNAELCATVCQFIALLLHFILFVWACVDTNRRNSQKVGKDAEKLAADIIANMIKSGAIIPAPGQAHMRPMPMQMQPFPPQMMQGYPQYAQYPQYPPQHQPQMMQQQPQHFSRPLSSPNASQGPTGPLPGVPSSSNEKSAAPRFA